ncbi:hypothetical protein [Blautia luti]|uniref:hypothetical protein n=1 Tax=Blautia luti TaxID=89014 RepID=UPI0018AC83AF|nr:hypothetical protein [Blautia luti]
MANKLQKLFSNNDLSLSLQFSFDDEAARQSFINAIKKATEEGVTVHPEGTVMVNSSIRNEKSIFYTSDSNKLTQMEISPSKEEFSLDIPTELGSFKLIMQKYYTPTHMFLETPEDAVVYIKAKFLKPAGQDQDSSLPAATLTYRIQPENASSIQELAEKYSVALAFIQGLFGTTAVFHSEEEHEQYMQMQKFFSLSILRFQKLMFIQQKFHVEFSPEQLKHTPEDWQYVEEIYYLLKEKKALRLNAKVNEQNINGDICGNLTASPLSEIQIGQALDITFQNTAEYIIFDHPFKLYTASLLSNAIVRKTEQISDSQVKILYGNAEDNPMFISYTGFMTEQEAIDEMGHIMEHKEEYTEAVELAKILEN